MSARNSFTAQSCRLTDVAVREAATFNEHDFYSEKNYRKAYDGDAQQN